MNQALKAEQMASAPGFPSPFLERKPPGVAIRRSSSMFRQWVCRLSRAHGVAPHLLLRLCTSLMRS